VDTIKALVLTIGIFSQFSGPKPASLLLEKLQTHSLHAARIVQIIAKAERVDKKMADDAFLAGIMHDVGKLVLINKDPEMYEGALTLARTEKLDIDPVEREVFGASHAEVGCYLLWLWGLPQAVTEAVAFHHRPAECPATGMSAVALVHIADALAHEFEPGSDFVPQPDESFLAATGLSGRLAGWRELVSEATGVGEKA
jgi:HD-like signal output (HDOD) protein